MKKTRQLHLWIGLICSIFILLQSATGLLLSEKQLFGLAGGMGGSPTQAQAASGMSGGSTSGVSADMPSKQAVSDQAASDGRPPMDGNRDNVTGGRGGQAAQQGVMGLIKGLHEGKIGHTDVRWLIDLGAIGMIVLTVTGIVMSVKTLRAQSVQRKRRLAAIANA